MCKEAQPLRDIRDIYEPLKEAVPEDQVQILGCLQKVYESEPYTPPEGRALLWRRLMSCLQAYIGEDPQEEWQKKAINIFMGKEYFEIDK